ncbi:hypothetical protein D3C71_1776830 [compost metagenome]
MHTAELRHGFLDHGLHRGTVGHVTSDCQGRTALVADRGSGFVWRLQIAKHHLRALGSQGLGISGTDALRGTGNDRDFSIQSAHCVFLYLKLPWVSGITTLPIR